ncbi:hypothetical protein VUR80DRAFT_887 [Thermomyces stellatus]
MPRHLCGQHNLSRCLTCVYFGLPSLPARIFARSSIRFEVHVNIVDTTFASAGVLGPKTGRTCFLAPSAPAPASDLAGSTGVVGMRREVCWSRGGPGDKAGIPEPPKTSQRLGWMAPGTAEGRGTATPTEPRCCCGSGMLQRATCASLNLVVFGSSRRSLSSTYEPKQTIRSPP